MFGQIGHAYLLVGIKQGKEQEFANLLLSKGLIFDPEVERLDFVYGPFDFIIILTGTTSDIDRRILEIRRLPYVQSTETLIPFEMLSWDDASMPIKDFAPNNGAYGKPVSELDQISDCFAPIILYSTKGGKTKKIALELGSQLNCPCIEVNKNAAPSTMDLSDFDLVLIGTGIYQASPNPDMVSFLKSANLDGDKKFALFLTWYKIGQNDKSVYDKMYRILENRGKKLLNGYFECLGDNSKGHPNTEDLAAARNWVKNVGKKTK
jgi:flavodoxin